MSINEFMIILILYYICFVVILLQSHWHLARIQMNRKNLGGVMAQGIFSDELNAYISEWKDKPGNLIMILHRVQEEF